MHRFLFCLFTLSLLWGCGDNQAPVVTHLQLPGNENSDLPYSAAVQVGHTLYLSGTLGSAPGSGALAAGGIQPETRQAMENIKALVEQFGSSMDRIAKCTVFLADMNEWSAMNEVYVTYFNKPPARSAIAAAGLGLDARIEIECIAVVE